VQQESSAAPNRRESHTSLIAPPVALLPVAAFTATATAATDDAPAAAASMVQPGTATMQPVCATTARCVLQQQRQSQRSKTLGRCYSSRQPQQLCCTLWQRHCSVLRSRLLISPLLRMRRRGGAARSEHLLQLLRLLAVTRHCCGCA
jgi:hypothetical protein